MSKGSNQPTTTTVNQNSLPPYAQPYVTQLLQQGQALSQNAYTPYPGSQLAPFSDQQMQSFNLAGQLGQATNPIFQSAQGQYNNAAGVGQNLTGYQSNPITANFNPAQYGGIYNPNTVTSSGWNNPAVQQSYMDPYTKGVIDPTLAYMQNQNAIQQAQLAGNAASQGAYGGDRMAVEQGVLGGQQSLGMAQTVGQLQEAGYQNSAQQFQADQARNLQAQMANLQSAQYGAGLGTQQAQTQTQADLQAAIANEQARAAAAGIQLQGGNLGLQSGYGLAGLGSTMQNANLQDIAALQTAGGMQQAQLQSGLNIGYQDFLNQLNWPYQQLGFQSNLIHGLPIGSVGQTQTFQNPNLVSQMLGLGLGGIGLSQALGGTGSTASGMI